MNLFFIFLTGLTTGGLSCLAMQGGLLASVIANQKGIELKDAKKTKLGLDQMDWLPVGMFLLTKLITHTILGFFLGLLGSALTLNLNVQLAFQAFAALFMFGSAMNLLNVHPIFRYLAFQPPKFLSRMVRNTSKSRALFAPAVLGAMTVFVPCGITQAMEVLAINSGNPVYGAMLMFAFVLGTSPLFAILGVATSRMSEQWNKRFTKVAAFSLIAMAVYGLNGVLIVMNSPVTVQRIISPVTYFFSEERFSKGAGTTDIQIVDGVQKVNIQVLDNGYSPSYLKVKSGVPVELTLSSDKVYSCALSFVFKEFDIKTFLAETDSKSFTFTPTKPGKYPFTCSMGMYRGVMEVI